MLTSLIINFCHQIRNELGRCGVFPAAYGAVYSTVCENAVDGLVSGHSLNSKIEQFSAPLTLSSFLTGDRVEPLNNVHVGPSNFVLYRGFFSIVSFIQTVHYWRFYC